MLFSGQDMKYWLDRDRSSARISVHTWDSTSREGKSTGSKNTVVPLNLSKLAGEFSRLPISKRGLRIEPNLSAGVDAGFHHPDHFALCPGPRFGQPHRAGQFQ